MTALFDTTGAADDQRLAQTRHFLQAQHVTPAALEAVGAWFHGESSRPLHLRDFLLPARAEASAHMLEHLPIWTRVRRVHDGNDGARYVDDDEWDRSEQKWASSWIARPITDALVDGAMAAEDKHALEQFLAFAVLGGPLTAWLSAATGVDLSDRGTVELAAYSRDDYLGEHKDRIGARVFALNFYLDREYRVGTGARLGYRNEHGETFAVDPVYNSMSIIPIQPDSVHWVEPYSADRRGRLTISVGQNRRTEAS